MTNVKWDVTSKVSEDNANQIINGEPVWFTTDHQLETFTANFTNISTSTKLSFQKHVLNLFRAKYNVPDEESQLIVNHNTSTVSLYNVILANFTSQSGGMFEHAMRGLIGIGNAYNIYNDNPPPIKQGQKGNKSNANLPPINQHKQGHGIRTRNKHIEKSNANLPPINQHKQGHGIRTRNYLEKIPTPEELDALQILGTKMKIHHQKPDMPLELVAYAFDTSYLTTYLLLQHMETHGDTWRHMDCTWSELTNIGEKGMSDYKTVYNHYGRALPYKDMYDFAEAIDKQIMNHGRTHENKVVYRGQSMPFISTHKDVFSATPGNPIDFICPTFLSTTDDIDVAHRFSYTACCVMQLTVVGSVKGVVMQDFNNTTLNEKEILFPRDCIISVTGVTYDNKYNRLLLTALLLPRSSKKTDLLFTTACNMTTLPRRTKQFETPLNMTITCSPASIESESESESETHTDDVVQVTNSDDMLLATTLKVASANNDKYVPNEVIHKYIQNNLPNMARLLDLNNKKPYGGGTERQGFTTAMTAVLGLVVVVTAMVPR
jgi:hypothetical protein